MSIERELLKRVISGDDDGDFFVSCDLYKEIHELLAQPEQVPKFNFDLERMKAAIESPISDVTVDDLAKQVKQEPVAWMWTRNYEGGGYTNKVFEFLNDAEEYAKDSKTLKSPDIICPLYTAPPKREPLSDEEIATLWGESYSGTTQMVRNFARAIEQQHGIGGGE